jgi:hypothetical protein
MRIKEVFESVKKGELTKLEKLDLIKKITEDYDNDRSEMLSKEVKSAIFKLKNGYEIDPEILLKEALTAIQEQYLEESIDNLKISLHNCLAQTSKEKKSNRLNVENIFNSWANKGINISIQKKIQVLHLMMAICFVGKEHGEDVMHTLMDIYELKKFDELIKEKPKKKQKVKESNNGKLYIASEWMDPLVERIASLEIPTHEQVKKIINDEYSEFELLFDIKKLKTPYFAKGRLNKTSIGEALKFIYEKKYTPKTIKVDSIIRKYNDNGTW